jgi:hypothetical protein
MRIKWSDLCGMVERLNRCAGVKKGVDEFMVDAAYGGYRLSQISGKGERDVSPRGTMRETYNFAWAMAEGIEFARRREQ